MAHFYLPEIDPNANITTPPNLASWTNNLSKIILGISDGIVIDQNAITRGVSSIPDIWARPLLFQSALKEGSNHPLRSRCINEWRGLLSLMALNKIKPELDNLEIHSVEFDNAFPKITNALKKLCPNPVTLQENTSYEWTNIFLIVFDGIPLGAFSPSTLVFTGVDYNKKLLEKVFPFKDEQGYLKPPDSVEDGLEYVGEWLCNLQIRLNELFDGNQNNSDYPIIGNINKLIKTWLLEIRNTLGVDENAMIDASRYKVAQNSVNVKGKTIPESYEIYRTLLRPMVTDEDAADEAPSDVMLGSTRNTEKMVVVITEQILGQQVNLWNEMRPRTLGSNSREIMERVFKGAFGTTIGTVDISNHSAMWICPEKFFLTSKLVKSVRGDILPEMESELNVSSIYILPFRDEILNYFSPDDIKNILKPSFKEENGIVVFSFNLPVGNKTVLIEKVYKSRPAYANEGLLLEIDPPVVELFPDYLGENWRKYFLFNGDSEHYKVTPLFKNKDTVTIKSRNRTFHENNITQGTTNYVMYGENAFPEAVLLDSFENGKSAQIGLVLLSRPGQRGLAHHWIIGIDFGTSNTNVYKQRSNLENAESWSYNFPEYYRTIFNSDENFRERILEDIFFPTRKISLPIPTTLKIYNMAVKDELLLDYFIFFPMHYKFPDNVLTNIKWNEDVERKTEYFLESLLFLLSIEIVKEGAESVQIACSYPKAFSQENITVFQAEWEEKVIKNMLINSTAKQVLIIHNGDATENGRKVKFSGNVIFETEGVAAGEYFASEKTISNIIHRANKAGSAICLDVGGGTTDISLWFSNEIIADSSVVLAGKEIASLIQQNRALRELIFSREAAIALDEVAKDPGYFSARLNLILKNEESDIQERLITYANNPHIQWLRRIIAIEFGALAFFAAELTMNSENNNPGLMNMIVRYGINLHWGGNAAKLVSWIDYGKFNEKGIASKLLNAIFYNCIYDNAFQNKSIKPGPIKQRQSPGHKSEASGGLVVMNFENRISKANASNSIPDMTEGEGTQNNNMQSMPDENNDDHNGSSNQYMHKADRVLCGDNIVLQDNKSISFSDTVTNHDFFTPDNKLLLESASLERFERFIKILNYYGVYSGFFSSDSQIIITQEHKRLIKQGVYRKFQDLRMMVPQKRTIEPVFITEIKLLMEFIKSDPSILNQR